MKSCGPHIPANLSKSARRLMFAKRNVNRLFKRSLTIVKCDAVRFPCMKESTNKKKPTSVQKDELNVYIERENKVKSGQCQVFFFFNESKLL